MSLNSKSIPGTYIFLPILIPLLLPPSCKHDIILFVDERILGLFYGLNFMMYFLHTTDPTASRENAILSCHDA